MGEFGKEVKINNYVTTIYIDDTSVEDWLKSGTWISLLYNDFLHAAKQIIYFKQTEVLLANVVSETVETVANFEIPIPLHTEIVLSKETLLERLETVLQWAEDREYYEDCAHIRDMIIKVREDEEVCNSSSL